MFKNYKIINNNDEEVLILYIDMNAEFAKLKTNKKTTINKEINNYINNNKIKFKGGKIVLMAGSLLLGTLIYTAPIKNNKNNIIDYNYSTNIVNIDENINIKVEEKEEVKEEIKKEETVQNKETNIVSNKVNTPKPNKKPSNTSTSKTEEKQDTTIKEEVKKEETKKEEIQTPTLKNPITIKRSNGNMETLEFEDYIIGVVSAEMPASFHSEALKAQAIAARTYALKAIEDGKTLTDTVSTQVYQDINTLKNKWGNSFNTYYEKVKKAVFATEGLVMKYNGSLINAYYHSTSNGYTEDATAVFGSFPYLQAVESPMDKNVSSYLRTINISYKNISNKLNIPVTSLSSIKIERNKTNRVSNIIIDNNIYGGVEFRTKLGLRSTDFDITLNVDNITITTRGYGHGVGMSQYGAQEYAKTGMNYQNILKHYYTGITIEKY